ncbi:MAG: MoaD/ThiS family protein [Dehalococcoidales bacterium]|nr:MoaD/ThiS family protein [Dehalococcoidales bacterium]
MASVKINIPSYMRSSVNDSKEVKVSGNTVGECFNDLIAQFPDTKKHLFNKNGGLYEYIIISVNGESAYPEQLDKKVKKGDELGVVMIIGGG